MRFKHEITACFRLAALVVAVGVFGFALKVSAFEQGAGQPPQSPQQTASTQATVGTTKITADEAVRLALENNLGIQAERLGPEIGTIAVAQARAVYTPSLISTT